MKIMNTLLGGALVLAASAATAAEPAIRPLGLDAADLYREQARYPRSSQALRDGVDPILNKRQINKQFMAGPNGEGPMLSIWNSAISYEPGEKVQLFAELVKDTAVKPIDLLRKLEKKSQNLTVTAKLVGETSGLMGEVTYRDDGKGADRRAGDGIYSASFTMPKARAPQAGYAESVAVHVQAQTSQGEFRGALGGFLYSNPGARLTGRYRDEMRDGNMVVSAEVNVIAPGRYHLAATMDSGKGADGAQPMAWAQNAAVLQPGKQWIDLTYYGLIFHDMAAAGPYTMSSITLTSALSIPNAMTSVQRNVYSMPVHEMSAFQARPFNNPLLMDAAQRLEADAQAK